MNRGFLVLLHLNRRRIVDALLVVSLTAALAITIALMWGKKSPPPPPVFISVTQELEEDHYT